MSDRAALLQEYGKQRILRREQLTGRLVRLTALQTVLRHSYDRELDRLLRKRYSKLTLEVDYAIEHIGRQLEALTGTRKQE